jgi:serine/threonine protein kinase
MARALRGATNMEPLDGLNTASERRVIRGLVDETKEAAKRGAAKGAPMKVSAYLKMAGGVIVGKGAYGVAWSVPAAAVLNKDFTAVASLRHAIPSRSTEMPPPNTRVVLKISKAPGMIGVTQGYHEIRVHAYLADPTIKTGDLPKSSDYVPKYYAGAYSPTLGSVVTVMELVDGQTMSSLSALTPRAYSELEMAFMSLWARRIFHADAHSGNVFLAKFGGVRIIDFGLSLVLPESMRAKSFEQAASVPYFKKLDEFAFLYHAQKGYDFSNPNTLALRVYRNMVPASNSNVNLEVRRSRNGFEIGKPKPKARSPLESGEIRSDAPKNTKPPAKKPAPKPANVPKPAPKMPDIPWEKPAQKKASAKPAPKNPTPKMPKISFGSSVKTANAPRMFANRATSASDSATLARMSKKELLAMARAMKKEGYNVGRGCDILLKHDLIKRIGAAKKAGKATSGFKTVKNLKANAKKLGVAGAYAMKRANLISAIRKRKE